MSLEPYDSRDLARWLTSRGFHQHSQNGSHTWWLNADGISVPCPDHRGSVIQVTTPMAADLAKRLGMSIYELRSQFGKAPGRRKNSSHRVASRPNVIVHVPPLEQIVKQIVDDAVAIGRSGQCRKASAEQLAGLLRGAAIVRDWKTRHSSVPTVKRRAA